MRQLYLFGLFLCSATSFAQLSVKPSQTGDSYLYVHNEVIYVEDDISLTKNTFTETEASIYLRHESQLIQGEKTTNTNTGDGVISVFQEGTSNAYDYNYWASPVIDNNTSSKEFGNILFEPETKTRSKQAGITTNYEGSANPLKISNRWIYKYSGAVYNDWKYVGGIFEIDPGEGFTMKGVNGINTNIINGIQNNPGNQQRYDFRGIPNDGDIEVYVAKDQNTLVGNPYPSAIDLKTFLLENPNTTGIAYFWDSRVNGNSHYLEDYEGGYGAYSPGGNIYVPAAFSKYNSAGEYLGETGATGGDYAREFAPIAQGFMVAGATSGNLVFKNSHRIFKQENSENSQFKTSKERNNLKGPERFSGLRLNIEINDLYIRQLALVFRSDATKSADWAMDAKSFNDLATDATWLVEDESYIINVRPFDQEEKIPLFLRVKNDTQVHITAYPSGNMEADKIFIYDSQENNFLNIQNENQKFLIKKGEYPQRFFICFKDDSLSEEEIRSAIEKEELFLNTAQIFQNNSKSQLEIRLLENISVQWIKLYNLSGSLILSKEVPQNQKQFVFSTSNLQDAVYIVTLLSGDNKKITRKVTIRN